MESTASRHQYFITKRGVLISCLDFSLLRQAGVSRLTRCDERVSVSCVLPVIITKSGRSCLEHCNEWKFPSRASPLLPSWRSEISVSRPATSGTFLSRVSWTFSYRAWLRHQQLDRRGSREWAGGQNLLAGLAYIGAGRRRWPRRQVTVFV
jgi:hypothetical protein